jgi:hypothetical protein
LANNSLFLARLCTERQLDRPWHPTSLEYAISPGTTQAAAQIARACGDVRSTAMLGSVMKKLLLATVCVIVLTIGAQARPEKLGLVDNRWVIEYDSELVAGACIATMDSPFETEDFLY